jgi:hypothetical protein
MNSLKFKLTHHPIKEKSMPFSEDQVMLTLAALAYRGFQDPLNGTRLPEFGDALQDGLDRFEPVRNQWELVWGPAATRQVPLRAFLMLAVFDWNSLYVVRHRTSRNKYVIAIRGTNPIASQDWLFGDLWVGTTVPWPYGSGKELISTSTALGLASIQTMRSGLPSVLNNLPHTIAKETRIALHAIALKAERAIKGLAPHRNFEPLAHVEQQLRRIVEHWMESSADRSAMIGRLQQLGSELLVEPQELRPKLTESQSIGNLDLLTFLKAQTDNSSDGLEVIVTGHSKGGALAPTVALWLKEALASDETECWDKKRKAKVSFRAFAGPTPGNAAFAERIDTILNEDCHYLVNSNDVVPHAFEVDELAQIPTLYGDRTAALKPLVTDLVNVVKGLNYRHSAKGVRTFAGPLNPARSFAAELVYQHLDGYLAELSLLTDEMNAFTCFV